jgi:hypothetical protein
VVPSSEVLYFCTSIARLSFLPAHSRNLTSMFYLTPQNVIRILASSTSQKLKRFIILFYVCVVWLIRSDLLPQFMWCTACGIVLRDPYTRNKDIPAMGSGQRTPIMVYSLLTERGARFQPMR